MQRILTAVLFVLLACPKAPAQGGSVEGLILRYGTNEPIAGARITIARPTLPGVDPRRFIGLPSIRGTEILNVSDARGRFVFSSLEPGNYILIAEADGYENSLSPGSRPQEPDSTRYITLRQAERVDRVSLSLVPLGRIGGVIRGPNGQRLAGATVTLGSIEYSDGRRHWDEIRRAESSPSGEYQFDELRPCDCYVVATGSFVITYAPSAAIISSATPISIRAGSDLHADVDVLSGLPIQRTISGKVDNGIVPANGPPVRFNIPAFVFLVPTGDALLINSPEEPISEAISPTGEFLLPNVPPGDYDLYAVSRKPPHTYEAHTTIDVTNGDRTGVNLLYDQRSAEKLRVRIVDENGVGFRSDLGLRARKPIPFVDDVSTRIHPGNDKTFEFTRVPPGTYDLEG